jgi:hypothetical protein
MTTPTTHPDGRQPTLNSEHSAAGTTLETDIPKQLQEGVTLPCTYLVPRMGISAAPSLHAKAVQRLYHIIRVNHPTAEMTMYPDDLMLVPI